MSNKSPKKVFTRVFWTFYTQKMTFLSTFVKVTNIFTIDNVGTFMQNPQKLLEYYVCGIGICWNTFGYLFMFIGILSKFYPR